MAAQLRLCQLSAEEDVAEGPAPNVRVSLGELLPLVAIAHRNNYAWLKDFLDDEVAITDDLYEVLRAFRVNRPTA